MGFDGFSWHKRTGEGQILHREKRADFSELIARSSKQVEQFILHNQNLVSVFIGSGYKSQIATASSVDKKISTAQKIAKENPHLVPDIIEDPDEQASFLIALTEELEKPTYKQ